MELNIKNKIISLEKEANMLKMIHNIRKYVLSCGAYSDKNMEMQNIRFEALNVPEWEKKIIQKSWSATKLLSHSLLKELDILNDLVISNYGDGKNKN
jgi:hypothetical protein